MMAKAIKKWEPEDFELEMTTHWSFPKRGDWATHCLLYTSAEPVPLRPLRAVGGRVLRHCPAFDNYELCAGGAYEPEGAENGDRGQVPLGIPCGKPQKAGPLRAAFRAVPFVGIQGLSLIHISFFSLRFATVL